MFISILYAFNLHFMNKFSSFLVFVVISFNSDQRHHDPHHHHRNACSGGVTGEGPCLWLSIIKVGVWLWRLSRATLNARKTHRCTNLHLLRQHTLPCGHIAICILKNGKQQLQLQQQKLTTVINITRAQLSFVVVFVGVLVWWYRLSISPHNDFPHSSTPHLK